ncbi:MAG TPA: hypothetical protein VH637_15525 [Streptosporangiaceae bacterium]|jgi:hypothetical protein
MHRMPTIAAGIALAMSLGAGLLASAPAVASTAGPARPANPPGPAVTDGPASTARPASTGAFGSWASAQHAAGFGLRKPARTFGLRRGPIVVSRCQAAGKLSRRNVIASYGSALRRLLALSQNNSGGACGNFGAARKLGHYRVLGRRATLWGACGKHIGPSCSSRKISLFLVWAKHRRYYLASSHNERRRTLVRFARGLRGA